jgi:hypothetical protein
MNDADAAIKTIEGFADLNFVGWDSYRATPIAPETIARAKLLVEALRGLDCVHFNPAPGADGSIGFEICWKDGRELWLDVQHLGQQMEAYVPRVDFWNVRS